MSLDALDTYSVMEKLYRAAEKNLTDDDLEWLVGGLEWGDHVARTTEAMVTGLGCLIIEDGGAGSFQSKDGLPELLFHIANSINHARSLFIVGDRARYALNERAQEAAQQKIKSAA